MELDEVTRVIHDFCDWPNGENKTFNQMGDSFNLGLHYAYNIYDIKVEFKGDSCKGKSFSDRENWELCKDRLVRTVENCDVVKVYLALSNKCTLLKKEAGWTRRRM